MNILNLSTWCEWGQNGLNNYLDRVQDVFQTAPSTPVNERAKSPEIFGEDAFEGIRRPQHMPRAYGPARVNDLRARKRTLDSERLSNQRSYYAAEFMLGASVVSWVVGFALFSSPFTIPLAAVLTGGGILGSFTFYPRRQEYSKAVSRLETELARLDGRIEEAER